MLWEDAGLLLDQVAEPSFICVALATGVALYLMFDLSFQEFSAT